MAGLLRVGIIVSVVVVLAEATGSCDEACMSTRFAELEKRLGDHEIAIQGLQRTVADQESTIQTQDRLIQQIQQELRTERQSRKKQSLLLDVIKKDIRRVHQQCSTNAPVGNIANKEGMEKETANRIRLIDPLSQAFTKRQERAGISFTTFLDHNINTANHQTVKFNQIITNEGNGYNIHTGVFTCPEAGMYLFIFNIGERGETAGGVSEVGIRLVVNSANIIDAVADSFHSTQDMQGGNAVIQRLKAGDSVWIETGSGHVVGSASFRLTTFSGVFLYP